MRSNLDELQRELEELKDFISSIAHVSDALASHTAPALRRHAALRRRFDNAAFVVALYASFEQYIENLAASFARIEAQRLPYSELPQKLAAKHLQRSADLLSRGRLGEGRYAGLTPAGVVGNLNNCLSGIIPYALNDAAIVWHDANFRAKDIDDMFLSLGIDSMCKHARRGDSLQRWHMSVQGLTVAPADGVPDTVVDKRINELVERRNQVAHRGGNPEDLFGVADMEESVGFINALSSDIFSVVVGRYLIARHGADSAATKLTQVIGDGPYAKGTVVIVTPPDVELAVGQPVYALRDSGPTRWGRIQNLRIDEHDFQTVAAGTPAPKGIGVQLDFACTANSELVVLSVEDDLVWASGSTVSR